MISLLSSLEGDGCSLSVLILITSIFLVTFILFTWLIVALVCSLLVVAAQIIFMSQAEFLISKDHLISSLLTQIFCHCTHCWALRPREIADLRGKCFQSWINFPAQFIIEIRTFLRWFVIWVNDFLGNILFHQNHSFMVFVGLLDFLRGKLISHLTIICT
jgi:hypothetical protein